MRSSSGQYYVGLDHLRGVAIFLVFCWHFIHAGNGHLADAPIYPFSLLAEGHTGVALFMCLSGYLMAKLMDGRRIHFGWFLYNRLLRLLPLLAVVFVIRGVLAPDLADYMESLVKGLVLPTWPNGGWSIAIEMHFYLLLPLFLWGLRTHRWLLSSVIALAIMLRALLHQQLGEVQSMAYWTLIGRIDQFLLGMLAYHYGRRIAGRHGLMALAAASFAAFYLWFDRLGGFYTAPSYPSPHPVWIVMTTIEGLFYGLLIAWYDDASKGFTGRISRAAALIGRWSYSLYLLHFFIVFEMAEWVHANVISLSNLYVAMAFAVPAFAAILPLAYVSFRFVESPFLALRKRYVRD